jgi:hypothetical protein
MKLTKLQTTPTGSIWTLRKLVNILPASVHTDNPKAKGWFLVSGKNAPIEVVEFFSNEDRSFNTLAEVKEFLKSWLISLKDDPIFKPTPIVVDTSTPSKFETEAQRKEFFKDWLGAEAHPEDIAEGMIA